AEAPTPLDIASWLECKDHAGGHLAASGLVRIRRLVRSRAHAMADWMRRLSREPDRCDPFADAAIELREARAGTEEVDRIPVDAHEALLELAVPRRELADDEVLRVVAPVAVRADPDLEECWLAFDHGARGRRCERPDSRPRPQEREAESEVDP